MSLDKLSGYLEDSKAEKLADQLFKVYGSDSSDSKKRSKRKYRVS